MSYRAVTKRGRRQISLEVCIVRTSSLSLWLMLKYTSECEVLAGVLL